jgi:hypothetical protein
MGILDALFGRSKPAASKSEQLFAMATASVTLETKLGLQPAGSAGVVFRPVDSGYFREAESEVQQLLNLNDAGQQPVKVRSEADEFGFHWIVLSSDAFEDLVANIHMVSLTLTEKGFGEQLLAAVFRLNQTDESGRAVYWIYNYKRGSFYPLVPRGDSQQRDNAAELHFASVMEHELPMEKGPEYWYAIWRMPF